MIRSTADGTLQSCDMRTQILAQPLLTFLHARGPMVLRLAPTSLTTHRPTSLIPPLTSLPWKLANDKAETKYVIITGMYVSSKSFFLFSLANTDPSSLATSPHCSRERKHLSRPIRPLAWETYQFRPLFLYRLPRRYSDRHRETALLQSSFHPGLSLHFATANGHTNIVRTLLLHGVTPKILVRDNGEYSGRVERLWFESKDTDLRERGV
jgi:hypothetical protein